LRADRPLFNCAQTVAHYPSKSLNNRFQKRVSLHQVVRKDFPSQTRENSTNQQQNHYLYMPYAYTSIAAGSLLTTSGFLTPRVELNSSMTPNKS
jgi:ABC-type Fe3+-siderophore transport system permease subunit